MDPSEANLITVTTPSGTTTQKDGAKGIAGAVRQGAAAAAAKEQQQQQQSLSSSSPAAASANVAMNTAASVPKLPQGSLAPLQQQAAGGLGTSPSAPAPATPGAAAGAGVLSQGSILGGAGPLYSQQHQAANAALSSVHQQHPHQSSQEDPSAGAGAAAAAAAAGPSDGSRPPLEFNHAINYVNKIKQRFSNDPETYKQFLEILQTYQKEGRAIQDVYAQVTVLFEGAKDLLDEFKQFLPDTSAQPGASQPQLLPTQPPVPIKPGHVTGNSGAKSNAAQAGGAPQRGKKRAAPGEAAASTSSTGAAGATKTGSGATAGQAASSRSKKVKHGHKGQPQQPQPQQVERSLGSPGHGGMHAMVPADQAAAAYGLPPAAAQQLGAAYAGPDGLVPADAAAAAAAAAAGLVPSNVVSAGIPLGPAYAPLATLDEVAFFDRVKKHIDDRGAYLEFLKLLNLYTQDVIDVRTLVDKAAAFIGGHRDLFATFKSLCGYEMGRHGWLEEEEAVIENTPALERPRIDLNTCEQYGASYRRLPKEEVNLACSGRDAMCWEVLNDEWVSHPTWASEGEGFNPHKKNVYEDALYRSEEERHEYDYHIEANLRTIALLEPIAARIAAMDEQERANFRLKPGLGGQSRSIYQRVLRKIYGRDAGAEIVAALHDSPSTSIPVVLARLRQKDEEWKRAQREWNKVWRVVDERNWWKSLDHRGVSWKTFDKKAITTRGLLGEIELRRAEDVGRRWMKELGGPRSLLGVGAGSSSKTSTTSASAKTTQGSNGIEGDLGASVDVPWHLAFDFSDRALLFDVIKLALSHLDRGPSYSRGDIDRIEIFIRAFLPLLFGEDAKSWEDEIGLEPVSSADDEDDDGNSTSSQAGAERRRKDEDLRTRVLRGQAAVVRTDGNNADSDAQMVDGSRAKSSDPLAMEQTWIRAETRDTFDSSRDQRPTENTDSQGPVPATSSQPPTWLNFFCSTQHYAFLRLFQLAYVRLGKMKRLAAELGREVDEKNEIRKARGQRATIIRGNPLALRLGLQDRWSGVGSVVGSSAAGAATDANEATLTDSSQPHLPSAPVSGWELHPNRYYVVLLDLIEKLFDGDSIDQNMYEESVRFMFGIEGYVVFTIDKLFGGLVKTAQSIINDSKCTELQALLDKSKRNDAHRQSTQKESSRDAQAAAYRHQIATRMSAECLVGKEEPLFRVGWSPTLQRLGFQLLSRDDPSADLPPYIGVGVSEGDVEKLKEQRWLYYISSYSLWAPTEGLMGEAKGPFLKRNVDAAAALVAPSLGGEAVAGASCEETAGTRNGHDAAADGGDTVKSSADTVSPAALSTDGGKTRYITEAGLEIKVCISSYKLFFVQDTEDTFARVQLHDAASMAKRKRQEKSREGARRKTFNRWFEKRRRDIDEGPQTTAEESAPAAAESTEGGVEAQKVDAQSAKPNDEGQQLEEAKDAVEAIASTDGDQAQPPVHVSSVIPKVEADSTQSLPEPSAATSVADEPPSTKAAEEAGAADESMQDAEAVPQKPSEEAAEPSATDVQPAVTEQPSEAAEEKPNTSGEIAAGSEVAQQPSPAEQR